MEASRAQLLHTGNFAALLSNLVKRDFLTADEVHRIYKVGADITEKLAQLSLVSVQLAMVQGGHAEVAAEDKDRMAAFTREMTDTLIKRPLSPELKGHLHELMRQVIDYVEKVAPESEAN